MKNFFEKLEKQCKDKDSLLCVGLDPRLDITEKDDAAQVLFDWNKRIIDGTLPYTVCYKPNIAFYEVYGPAGLEALEKILDYIPEEVPVILDAKRNDIGATAEAYAKSIFEYYDVDCVTLSPYMGRDSIDPFLSYGGRGVFVLCRTSNASAVELQDLQVEGTDLYKKTAEITTSWGDRVGLVVAGNDLEALSEIRSLCPDTWFLAPGIGAQGGTMAESVSAGMRADGLGILPMVGRAVAGAEDPGKAARDYVEKLREARKQALVQKDQGKQRTRLEISVLNGLIDTKCFKLGEFVLKSGKKSPFYIDLRRVSASAELLRQVARAYATLIDVSQYDSVAGIPIAAMPLATAVSLETGLPLIYPRMEMKKHGTGNRIEGEYKEGDRVLLLDDLITTGKSKVEAIEILRSAGLVVDDLVVLLERGVQGRRDMEAQNINLMSYMGVEPLFDMCLEKNLIDQKGFEELISYVKEG